ncbi:MAG: alpha/beta hydrolase-fold protein [Eubacteriales bacterium]|nr:alpha/beta hydrolase-fold protein [Eubacteriales bacterium]
MKKKTIPAFIAAAALSTTLFTGTVYAGDAAAGQKDTVESEAVSADAEANDAEKEMTEGGVTVEKNEDSRTGYTATFTYYDDKAANVKIQGGFTFYSVGDEYCYSDGRQNEDGGIVDVENHLYTPENWEPGLARYGDGGYIRDMTKDETTGAWTFSVDLPGGSYLYQYNVIDADGNEELIADPANIPYCNTLGASQVRSQFYVPYDAESQAESDDWTFVFPAENEDDRGTLIWDTYEGYIYEGTDSAVQEAEVYLPAHYDENREEPYKTLYLVHGGGGEEGDWFHQGNAGNIVDRLASEGKTEEFVMVAIDISTGTDEELCKNLSDYTIPYVEKNYNVSSEINDRALAGLSKGAKFTYTAHYLIDDIFGYFGAFSVGYPGPTYDIADAVNLNKAKLYLAGGYADHTMTAAFQEGQIPMVPFSEYLDENNIEYTGLKIVEGGHDWFTWQQILKDFVETYLWK